MRNNEEYETQLATDVPIVPMSPWLRKEPSRIPADSRLLIEMRTAGSFREVHQSLGSACLTSACSGLDLVGLLESACLEGCCFAGR